MKYKYIYFERIAELSGGKTDVWECRNNTSNSVLGRVLWCPDWRQYVFQAFEGYAVSRSNWDTLTGALLGEQEVGIPIFSAGCQRDIADFLEKQNTNHRRS